MNEEVEHLKNIKRLQKLKKIKPDTEGDIPIVEMDTPRFQYTICPTCCVKHIWGVMCPKCYGGKS